MFSNHTIQYLDSTPNYYKFTSNKPGKTILISGGIHGDEANGMFVALEFFKYLQKNSHELKSFSLMFQPKHLSPELTYY